MNQPWWEGDREDRGGNVASLYSALKQQAQTRLTEHARWLDLYRGYSRHVVKTAVVNSAGVAVEMEERRAMAVNELRNIIDTQVARLTRYWPRPMHQTSDADWDTRQRAEKLDRYVEGVMLAGEYEREARLAFIDAAIHGTGFVKIVGQGGGKPPVVERVAPWFMLFDELEATYCEPRTWMQWRPVDRGIALRLWGESEAIRDARRVEAPDLPLPALAGPTSHGDLVLALEVWHFPSGEGAGDGRHCIVVGDEAVVDEAWTRVRSPITVLRYASAGDGWWGQGLCEAQAGTQGQIGSIVRRVEDGIARACAPRVYVPKSSGVALRKLSGENGAVIEFDGAPPIFAPAQAFAPEIYQWLSTLRTSTYETAGVSQLASQAQKPAGLNSGRALRVWQDVESERHLVTGRGWEWAAIDTARVIVDEIRALAEEVGAASIKVRAPQKGTRSYRELTWADVELPEDAYTVSVYPVSALASAPAARIEQAMEYMQLGLLDPEDLPDILDLPDVPSWKRRRLSDAHVARWQIGRILADGEWNPPEPLVAWPVAEKVAREELLLAMMDGAPDDRIELVRRYLAEVQERAAQVAADVGAAAPPDIAPQPPGPPGLPPVGDAGGDVLPFPAPAGEPGMGLAGEPGMELQ